jgi:hypothetical protein
MAAGTKGRKKKKERKIQNFGLVIGKTTEKRTCRGVNSETKLLRIKFYIKQSKFLREKKYQLLSIAPSYLHSLLLLLLLLTLPLLLQLTVFVCVVGASSDAITTHSQVVNTNKTMLQYTLESTQLLAIEKPPALP